jgi:hypothetical protein
MGVAMPITEEQKSKILSMYKSGMSVHAIGRGLGLSHSTAHYYVKKEGLSRSTSYNDFEKEKIRELYKEGFVGGDGKLKALAKELGRPLTNIVRWARGEGLTQKHRKSSDELCAVCSKNAKEWIAKNGHPKGMAGKTHGQKARDAVSKATKERHELMSIEEFSDIVLKTLKTKVKRGNLYRERKGCSWKAGRRVVGGKNIYFRSRWEYNYSLILEEMKEKGEIKYWEHEPETFWFEAIMRGTRSYLPDFKIHRNDGSIYYVEVKGWMDSRSKTKLRRMNKYHPDVELKLVDSKAYKALEKLYGDLMPGWEKKT